MMTLSFEARAELFNAQSPFATILAVEGLKDSFVPFFPPPRQCHSFAIAMLCILGGYLLLTQFMKTGLIRGFGVN